MLEPEDLSMVSSHGQTYVVPKAPMTTYKDDWSVYNVQDKGTDGKKYLPAWWASNLDLRRSLDYIKHWQIGSGMQHDTGLDPGLALKIHGTWYDKDDGSQTWPGDENYDLKDHWSGTKEWRTNKYVMDTLLKSQLVSLQQAQYSAAEEAQYGPETFETVTPPPNAIAPGDWKQATTQPWRNYVDYAKDLPEAEGSDQLRDQLLQISAYKDRTAKQKAYLGNKAIVRYMMSTSEDRGGADALVKYLTENTDRTEMSHTMDSTKGDLAYEPQGAYASKFKYADKTSNRYLNYASPWANKGDGFLPTYVLPQARKLLERAQDVTTQQREGVLQDSSSWAHDTGAGTKPPKWNVNIHGALPDDKPPKQTERQEHLAQYQQGGPLPHAPEKEVKFRLGSQAPKITHEGKQKRQTVRFQEVDDVSKDRPLDYVIAHFSKYGAKGLSKSELKNWRQWEAEKGARKARNAGTGGDPTNHHDPYFQALDKRKGRNPFYWTNLRSTGYQEIKYRSRSRK